MAVCFKRCSSSQSTPDCVESPHLQKHKDLPCLAFCLHYFAGHGRHGGSAPPACECAWDPHPRRWRCASITLVGAAYGGPTRGPKARLATHATHE